MKKERIPRKWKKRIKKGYWLVKNGTLYFWGTKLNIIPDIKNRSRYEKTTNPPEAEEVSKEEI